MATSNAKVMAMVERALKRDSGLKSTELQARATKIDADVAKLSGRQFHAQYALPVRRRLAAGPDRDRGKGRNRQSDGRPAISAADPVIDLVTASYRTKKARLNEAIEAAFERTLAADSVKEMDRLLSKIDRRAREFESA